jgi:hypothetical protein
MNRCLNPHVFGEFLIVFSVVLHASISETGSVVGMKGASYISAKRWGSLATFNFPSVVSSVQRWTLRELTLVHGEGDGP